MRRIILIFLVFGQNSSCAESVLVVLIFESLVMTVINILLLCLLLNLSLLQQLLGIGHRIPLLNWIIELVWNCGWIILKLLSRCKQSWLVQRRIISLRTCIFHFSLQKLFLRQSRINGWFFLVWPGFNSIDLVILLIETLVRLLVAKISWLHVHASFVLEFFFFYHLADSISRSRWLLIKIFIKNYIIIVLGNIRLKPVMLPHKCDQFRWRSVIREFCWVLFFII